MRNALMLSGNDWEINISGSAEREGGRKNEKGGEATCHYEKHSGATWLSTRSKKAV